MKLNIITRCIRPKNLLKVQESIFDNSNPGWEIKWHIVIDTSSVSEIDTEIFEKLQEKGGHSNVKFIFWKGEQGDLLHDSLNSVIGSLENDSWVYMLDDDNVIHENFYNRTWELLYSKEHSGLIFSQYVGGKDFSGLEVRTAAVENICVGKIDMAQFLINKSMIDIKFVKNTYVADGIFISDLYHKNVDKFLIIDEILCYYNHLQKTEQRYSLPRVLIAGKTVENVRSRKMADYESDELYVINPDNKDIVKSIIEHDPDSIVTIGDNFQNFPQLCSMSYDFRQRWIHKDSEENIGELSYLCAMNFILGHNTENLVSIITPIYNTKEKLKRTYESVKKQTYPNWEWILINDSTDNVTGRIAREIAKEDPRVKVYEIKERTKGIIGESKYRACVLSNGNFLLELDHDDYLIPNALQLLVEAFNEFPEAGFAYSDCAEIDENYNSLTYGAGFALGYGEYRTETHFNHEFKVAIAPNINPLTIRHIVGVPNHFRAWRRKAYFDAGCHNRRLSITDDYELIVRTFLTTRMVKIPQCCYLQFFHGQNSQDVTRADIQRRVRTIYTYYNSQIKKRFEDLGKIDWAYSEINNPLSTPPRKGKDEGHVNLVFF